ncbi:MAG: regulatory protein RecX [Clostridiales bacterium]|nr:regulatory protein RecX [Clostridiales bacterium]
MVTKIQELSKSRSKVYIDGEFSFVLYHGELRHYGIEEGSEIEESTRKEILQTILPKRAKLRCMNLLKSREYTEKQLRNKLQQGFYPEAVVDEAIQYVKSFRYVDDQRYAESYIAYHLADKSRQRIRMDLVRKGISKEMVEKLLVETEGTGEEEKEQIKRLLYKKRYSVDMDLKEKQKIYGYLLRKGYRNDDIQQVMRIVQF